MIKFFRHIRQKLLANKRFGKYLLYALGEIILVVIGILIALQINNSNQQRLVKIEERIVLESLSKEIDENRLAFEQVLELHEKRTASIDFIMRGDFSEVTANGMDSLTLLAFSNWTFNASFGIYDAITNSGKIQLIANTELKNKISKFKETVFDYKEEETNLVKYTDLHVMGYLSDETDIPNVRYFGFDNFDSKEKNIVFEVYDRALRTVKFRNRISILSLMYQPLFEEAEIVRQEMKALQEMIEDELNNTPK